MATQSTIERLLAPRVTSGFLCLRLPPRGTLVVVVVEEERMVRAARVLLRRHRIHGRIEVASAFGYYEKIVRLAHRIEALRPRQFSSVNLARGVPHGAVTCPKITIQLGQRGSVPPAVHEWAREIVKHYGSDWITTAYTGVGRFASF